MDVDFQDVTEKPSKLTIIIFVCIVIALIVFGYFFVHKKYNFSLKNIKLEQGEKVSTDVNDYLKKKTKHKEDYKLDVGKVDSDHIGKYTYKVKMGNVTKKATVEVVDTTAPTFKTRTLTVEVGYEEFYVGDFVYDCKDINTPCVIKFKKDRDKNVINEVGTHDLTIEVSDIYNNSKDADVKLIVVEKGKLADNMDMEYDSTSVDGFDFKGEYYLKLSSAIIGGNEQDEKNLMDIASLNWLNYAKETYPGYNLKNTEVISIYNKNKYVIGYAVRLTLDNGSERKVLVTKQITADEEKNDEESTKEETTE